LPPSAEHERLLSTSYCLPYKCFQGHTNALPELLLGRAGLVERFHAERFQCVEPARSSVADRRSLTQPTADQTFPFETLHRCVHGPRCDVSSQTFLDFPKNRPAVGFLP